MSTQNSDLLANYKKTLGSNYGFEECQRKVKNLQNKVRQLESQLRESQELVGQDSEVTPSTIAETNDQLAQIQSENQNNLIKLQECYSSKESLQQERNALKKQVVTLQSQLKNASTDLEKIVSELATEGRNYGDLINELEKRSDSFEDNSYFIDNNINLQSDFVSQKNEKTIKQTLKLLSTLSLVDDLYAKVEELEEEKAALEQEIREQVDSGNEINTQLAVLERANSELKKKLTTQLKSCTDEFEKIKSLETLSRIAETPKLVQEKLAIQSKLEVAEKRIRMLEKRIRRTDPNAEFPENEIDDAGRVIESRSDWERKLKIEEGKNAMDKLALKDAEQKLKQTERDVVEKSKRADILEASLRQEKEKNVKDLAAAELKWSKRVDDMQTQQKKLNSKISTLEGQVVELQKDVEEKEEQVADLVNEKLALENKINQLTTATTNTLEYIERTNAEILALKNKVTILENKLLTVQSENEDLVRKNEQHLLEIDQLKLTVTQLTTSLAKYKLFPERVEELKSQLLRQSDQMKKLKDSYNRLRRIRFLQPSELENVLATMESESVVLHQNGDNAQAINEIEMEIDIVKKRLEEAKLEQELLQTKRERDGFSTQLSTKVKELEKASRERDVLQRTLASQKNITVELENLRTKYATTVNQLETKMKNIEALDGEIILLNNKLSQKIDIAGSKAQVEECADMLTELQQKKLDIDKFKEDAARQLAVADQLSTKIRDAEITIQNLNQKISELDTTIVQKTKELEICHAERFDAQYMKKLSQGLALLTNPEKALVLVARIKKYNFSPNFVIQRLEEIAGPSELPIGDLRMLRTNLRDLILQPRVFRIQEDALLKKYIPVAELQQMSKSIAEARANYANISLELNKVKSKTDIPPFGTLNFRNFAKIIQLAVNLCLVDDYGYSYGGAPFMQANEFTPILKDDLNDILTTTIKFVRQ